MDRREVRKQFKERVTAKGIFAVRCKTSGQVWVDSSRDLDASRNGVFFMLRNGSHYNQPLQKLFDVHGADAFEFEVLVTIDEETPGLLLQDALRDLRKQWLIQLSASQL